MRIQMTFLVSVNAKRKIPDNIKTKKEKENLPANLNKVETIYIHTKNTYIKIFKKWNNKKRTNEKYVHENI